MTMTNNDRIESINLDDRTNMIHQVVGQVEQVLGVPMTTDPINYTRTMGQDKDIRVQVGTIYDVAADMVRQVRNDDELLAGVMILEVGGHMVTLMLSHPCHPMTPIWVGDLDPDLPILTTILTPIS